MSHTSKELLTWIWINMNKLYYWFVLCIFEPLCRVAMANFRCCVRNSLRSGSTAFCCRYCSLQNTVSTWHSDVIFKLLKWDEMGMSGVQWVESCFEWSAGSWWRKCLELNTTHLIWILHNMLKNSSNFHNTSWKKSRLACCKACHGRTLHLPSWPLWFSEPLPANHLLPMQRYFCAPVAMPMECGKWAHACKAL